MFFGDLETSGVILLLLGFAKTIEAGFLQQIQGCVVAWKPRRLGEWRV